MHAICTQKKSVVGFEADSHVIGAYGFFDANRAVEHM